MKNIEPSDFFAAAKAVLDAASVECGHPIPLSECRIISPHKLEVPGFEPRSVLMFAAPYFSREAAGDTGCPRSISLYAVPRDYHIFFAELFSELRERLGASFPDVKFMCFADNSPIGEVGPASKAGLGMIGDNGLLISRRYGSFVFLGELICDLDISEPGKLYPVERCDSCGNCQKACPVQCVDTDDPAADHSADKRARCLSSLTQTKSEPGSEVTSLMRGEGDSPVTAWGCDTCQLVCPYNIAPEETPIEWFRRDLILAPTKEGLAAMSDEEFKRRAFSWRGRSVIERNLQIVGSNEGYEDTRLSTL